MSDFLPDYMRRVAEFDEKNFAKPYEYGTGRAAAAALKEFLANPDAEALDEVARQTKNPEFANEAAERFAEQVAVDFRNSEPRYHPSNSNYQAIAYYLAEKHLGPAGWNEDDAAVKLYRAGHWTARDLHEAFNALWDAGELDGPPNQLVPLSQKDKNFVLAQAASGDWESAAWNFVRFRRGKSQQALDAVSGDYLEIISEPATRALLDEANYFLYTHLKEDYVSTPEREEFLRHYIAGRPVTIALLNAAWAACKQNEQGYGSLTQQLEDRQTEILRDPRQSREELDRLSDDQVSDLLNKTRQIMARAR